jgi:TonB family protein
MRSRFYGGTMTISGFGVPPTRSSRTRQHPTTLRLSFLLLASLSILSFSLVPPSRAQQDAKTDRKLLTKVEPDYPPVLRMRQIGGTVKLEITISPRGSVESAKVLGGNPILAESAVAAVKKWKYVSADTPTTTSVSLEFNPYR